jgi:hypothetical protein
MALATGRVFLTRTGTRLQSSRSGLIRTILHSISTDCPSLIPLLFPEEWTHSARDPDLVFVDDRLNKAFETLKSSPLVYKAHRIAIFIDGLDEISDEYCRPPQLVEELRRWAVGNSVKICASSRVVPVIDNRLRQFPSLKLHTVNQGGIARFARDILAAEMEFLEDAGAQETMERLVRHVIDNSNGAFLWVSLILRDLVVGLNNANSLETLYNKTTSLPRDLDHLYNDLLLSMHRNDENQAYRFLSLALVSPQPCPLIQFSFLRDWVDRTDLPDQALPPLSSDKLKQCLATARRQVAGDCLGLLEIVDDPSQVELTLQARVRFAMTLLPAF